MGLRFDLQSANWVAYLLDRERSMPRLSDSYQERELLETFLRKVEENFVASERSELRLSRAARAARARLNDLPYGQEVPQEYLDELRNYLEMGPWAALIVPSLYDRGANNYLCSHQFLEELVKHEHWPDSGIVLQLEDGGVDRAEVVTDVFPSFRHALNRSTEWPGMLFWTATGEAAFLSFGSTNPVIIRERAGWMVSNIRMSEGMALSEFQKEYLRIFSDAHSGRSSILTLLHISDIHIGSAEASTRLGRLQQIIRNILSELPREGTVVPVVSGDIMDSPSLRAYDEADRFFDFLHNLNTEEPVIVLGNHDVRRDGHLEVDLSAAFRFRNELIRWIDSHQVGIACFNSNMEAQSKYDLATGKIGERQFQAMGNGIDRKGNGRDYAMIGLLHHHPMPVPRPDWYRQPYYERVFGKLMESTVELRDAREFRQFVKERGFTAVLHGHEHIPRVDDIDGHNEKRIPVVGCGSSVGKVPTYDDEIYVSINVITIDRRTSQMTARLLAERIRGGGARLTHEYVREIGRS